MRRGRILILFALILLLGAVAAFLVLSRLGGGAVTTAQTTPQPEFREAQIVIAAQDIPRGAVIPSDGVILSPFPADFVVETMVTDLDQVVGMRARMDIARGVPVTQRMVTQDPGDLLGTGSAASVAIPPGFTAITIPMDRFSGVGFAVQDGDAVDVIISLLMVDIDPDFQTLLPNETLVLIDEGFNLQSGLVCESFEQTAEGRTCVREEPPEFGRLDTEETSGQSLYVIPREGATQRPRLVSQRLVSNATILHVGEFELPGEEEVAQVEEPQTAQPQPEGQVQTVQQVQKPDMVTLIVTPQDALALNYSLKAGAQLTLTLRSPNDVTESETTSMTLQLLLDLYNITVPSRVPFGLEPVLEAQPRRWTPSEPSQSIVPITE